MSVRSIWSVLLLQFTVSIVIYFIGNMVSMTSTINKDPKSSYQKEKKHLILYLSKIVDINQIYCVNTFTK